MSDDMKTIKQIPSRHTDVEAFFDELDGGIVKQKLGAILSEAAAGTMDFKKNGKVVITLDMKKLGDSDMIEIGCKLDQIVPTAHGHRAETSTKSTPFYVGMGGRLSIFSKDQDDLFNDNKDKNRG